MKEFYVDISTVIIDATDKNSAHLIVQKEIEKAFAAYAEKYSIQFPFEEIEVCNVDEVQQEQNH